MLLLTSTSDKLQIVTGAAGTIDVHASWVDNLAGTITPGRTNTLIITAATTDVVGSPAASTQRNVQTLIVRNKHATNANNITVLHTDGTTAVQLFDVLLAADSELQYVDGDGWKVLDATGHILSAGVSVGIEAETVAAGDDFRFSPSQMIQVAENATVITGKWYSSVKAACDYAATVATTSNRYFIQVYPGEYTESPFTVPAFTFLNGSDDWGAVTISTNDNANHFITISANAGVSRFAVIGPTGLTKAALLVTSGTAKASWINLRGGDYGLYIAGGRVMAIGVVSDTGWVGTRLFTADGTGVLVLLASHAMIGTFTGKYGVHVSGSAQALMDLCVFRVSGGTGIYAEGSAGIRGIGITFAVGTTAIHQKDSAVMSLHSTVVKTGGFTTDILIEGAGGSFTYSGALTKSKITNTGSITPTIVAASAVGDATDGQYILGELFLGSNAAQTPLTSLIDAIGQTGKYSGGEVTRVAGRDVSVAAGAAMFDQGSVMKKVSWTTAVIALPANTDGIWVTVDPSGTVSSQTTEPDLTATVVLSQAVTDATDVMFLANCRVDLGNTQERTQTLGEKGIGAIHESGGVVSASGLGFDATAGAFFVGLAEHSFTAGGPATFTYWRRDGTGGWIQTASQSAVNTTQYDDGSGTLATMTAGFYRADLAFVSVSDDGTAYHVIIGQGEFASPAQAIIANFPVLPGAVQDCACQLALLVVQKSAGALHSVSDRRPKGPQRLEHYSPFNLLSAGTQVANTSGVVNFANSNGISFGMSGNSQITGSVETSYAASNHSHGNPTLALTNLSGTTASNSAGLTLSLSVGAGGAGDGVNILAAGTQTANTTGTVLFQNSNGITFGMSNSSVITASVGGAAPGSISAGTTRIALGEAVFSNANGISFGINGSTVTGSVATNYQSQGAYLTTAMLSNAATISNVKVSAGTLSANRSDLTFSNSNGISFGLETNGIITGTVKTDYLTTAALSNHSHGDPTLALTNISGTTASNSAGLTLSLSAAGAGAAVLNFSAGTTSGDIGSVVFSNSNGVSFGLNGSTITASVNAGGGGAVSQRWLELLAPRATLSNITNITGMSAVPFFMPFYVDGTLTVSAVYYEMSRATSGSNNFSMTAGIYTYANSTQISLLSSMSASYSNTATASVSGVRQFRVRPTASFSLTPGEYVMGMMFSHGAGSSASMNYNIRGGMPPIELGHVLEGANQYDTATSNAVFPFFGRLSATTAAFLNSVAASQVRGQFSGVSSPIPAWIGINSN